jgi:hypothetical protein
LDFLTFHTGGFWGVIDTISAVESRICNSKADSECLWVTEGRVISLAGTASNGTLDCVAKTRVLHLRTTAGHLTGSIAPFARGQVESAQTKRSPINRPSRTAHSHVKVQSEIQPRRPDGGAARRSEGGLRHVRHQRRRYVSVCPPRVSRESSCAMSGSNDALCLSTFGLVDVSVQLRHDHLVIM